MPGPDARELARLEHDLDAHLDAMGLITRPDAGASVLLIERLGLGGLRPESIAESMPGTFASMQHRCRRCRSWRLCAVDLARGDKHGAYYCPNAQVLEVLERDVAGGAAG